MARCGGIRVLLHGLAEAPPEVTPLLASIFLHIIDSPDTRSYLEPGTDLEVNWLARFIEIRLNFDRWHSRESLMPMVKVPNIRTECGDAQELLLWCFAHGAVRPFHNPISRVCFQLSQVTRSHLFLHGWYVCHSNSYRHFENTLSANKGLPSSALLFINWQIARKSCWICFLTSWISNHQTGIKLSSTAVVWPVSVSSHDTISTLIHSSVSQIATTAYQSAWTERNRKFSETTSVSQADGPVYRFIDPDIHIFRIVNCMFFFLSYLLITLKHELTGTFWDVRGKHYWDELVKKSDVVDGGDTAHC